jgi:hypothetical protein
MIHLSITDGVFEYQRRPGSGGKLAFLYSYFERDYENPKVG